MLFNIIDNIKISYNYNYMKFLESHFIEYIQSSEKISLHPSMKKIYASFPDKIEQLKNIIFYGPPGVGKYTQMLCAIKRYSASGLKYEKKLNCVHNKNNYYFKISDIHFEVDMALLGCNAKLLWNEIYNNMVDVLSSRTNKSGIIVCKNFHKIHGELLDCFYSYIQQNNTNYADIKFIFLTFLALILLQSCVSKKQILYMQDVEIFNNSEVTLKNHTLQVDDILKISVSTLFTV